MDCIESIVQQTIPGSYEIIVVDNDSRDGAKEKILSKYKEVQWVEMGYNAGFARANNAGMRIAKDGVVGVELAAEEGLDLEGLELGLHGAEDGLALDHVVLVAGGRQLEGRGQVFERRAEFFGAAEVVFEELFFFEDRSGGDGIVPEVGVGGDLVFDAFQLLAFARDVKETPIRGPIFL